MFISKLHLHRRTFLRGMGAAVALPLLDAMIPARTLLAATAARPAPRMAFVYFPHGAVFDAWARGAAAGTLTLGPILQPLSSFRNQLTIVSGVENRHAYGPVHAITPGTWLSGVSPRKCDNATGGATADQIAADHLCRDTPLRSIAVIAEPPGKIGAGAWEGEYDQSYSTTISFRGPSMPVRMESSPRALFETLFAHSRTPNSRTPVPQNPGTSKPRNPETSILDLVAGETATLRQRLGPADRVRLRAYLDTVRDIERRVAKAEAGTCAIDASAERSNQCADRLRLLFDMVALAFRADLTRVASVMMAAEASSMTYDHVGVPEPFHLLSHHQNDPANLDKLVRIQAYHSRVLNQFLETLAGLPEGDGSLLDRSFILYGSNMSDSHAHDHFPLPLALAGGGCGSLGGNHHLQCPERTPIANVLLTMLRRAGVPVESIGDSTGECVGL